MRIRNCALLSAVAALTVLAVACAGETPTQRFEELPPLAPDTGNLGLPHIAGFQVLTLVDDSVVKDSALLVRLARRRAEPTAASVRVARISAGIDSAIALGRALAFDLSPTRRLVFVLDRVSPVSPGYTSWRGTLQGGANGELSLLTANGFATASTTVSAPLYSSHRIEQLGGGFFLVVYVDYRKFLPD